MIFIFVYNINCGHYVHSNQLPTTYASCCFTSSTIPKSTSTLLNAQLNENNNELLRKLDTRSVSSSNGSVSVSIDNHITPNANLSKIRCQVDKL